MLNGNSTVLAGIGKLVVMNNAFYHSQSVDFTCKYLRERHPSPEL